MNFNLKKDYDAVFKTEAGERVLTDLYNFCGINAQIFNSDSHTTSFNSGKHRVGQRIQSLLCQTNAKTMEIAQLKTLNITKRS